MQHCKTSKTVKLEALISSLHRTVNHPCYGRRWHKSLIPMVALGVRAKYLGVKKEGADLRVRQSLIRRLLRSDIAHLYSTLSQHSPTFRFVTSRFFGEVYRKDWLLKLVYVQPFLKFKLSRFCRKYEEARCHSNTVTLIWADNFRDAAFKDWYSTDTEYEHLWKWINK